MTDLIGADLGLTDVLSKHSRVPTTDQPQKAKDFTTDQEVRWCPGCGDYVILNTMRNFLPELGLRRENIVFVSGIGCSSRFPYYLETYGLHSIHGRAPAIATGLALAREDLSVWVVTGDGDALSIGGNHLIHALRRNINLTILLFNNRIYGLTKGQYSPTSEVGKVTKSTPMGSLDQPFNPVSLALGAEASFVGRALDSDRKGLSEVLRAAAEHRGSALVEILQDCPIFNDGSFDALRKEGAEERVINVHHGEPIVFGANGEYCVVRSGFGLEVAKTADVSVDEIVVHDAHAADSAYAYALSRLSQQNLEHTVMGIFRQVSRPTYDDAARSQIRAARESKPVRSRRPAVVVARARHLDCELRWLPAAEPASLAGVVLAGGASLRAGRDKATKPVAAGLSGSSAIDVVEHVVSISDSGVSRCSWSPRQDKRCRICRRGGARRRARSWARCSRSARGLHAAAEAGAKRAFVCAVDVPFLTADLIDVLAARAAEVDADVVLPWDGSNHYLAAVYRTELADQVDELVAAGERNLPALVDRVDSQRIVISGLPPAANVKPAGGLRRLLHAGR